jgi:PAS domain S-box-containing protein
MIKDMTKKHLPNNIADTLINGLNMASWSYQADTKRFELQENAEGATGWTHAELNAEDAGVLDLIHPEDRGELESQLVQCAAGEEPLVSTEFRLRHRTGGYFWMRCSGTCGDTNGHQLTGLIENIHRHKLNEQALVESEEKFHKVVSGAGIGIMIIQNGRLAFANTFLLDLINVSQIELKMMEIDDILHPGDRSAGGRTAMLRFQNERSDFKQELHLRIKCGKKWRSMACNGTVIEWNGRPAVLQFMSDVTEKERLEGDLRQSQKMEAVGQLAGGVAHDFRNMLNVILGYGRMLEKKVEPDSRESTYIDRMLEAGARAESLVQQLLTFSRKEAMNPELFAPQAAAGGLIRIIGRILGKDIDIELDYRKNQDFLVNADRGQFEQVLTNLCVNARDAMDAKGELKIYFELDDVKDDISTVFSDTKPGKFVKMSVTDTGSGISPEDMEHIFEPFFTTKDTGKGTGLGLATVFAIVKRHKGLIRIDSTKGVGTTFHIYLPVAEQLSN